MLCFNLVCIGKWWSNQGADFYPFQSFIGWLPSLYSQLLHSFITHDLDLFNHHNMPPMERAAAGKALDLPAACRERAHAAGHAAGFGP